MNILKKSLPRRMFLRGAGASLGDGGCGAVGDTGAGRVGLRAGSAVASGRGVGFLDLVFDVLGPAAEVHLELREGLHRFDLSGLEGAAVDRFEALPRLVVELGVIAGDIPLRGLHEREALAALLLARRVDGLLQPDALRRRGGELDRPVRQATRLFASNLKSRGTQRFFQLVLLPKDRTGYQNLCRLISHAWMSGFYYVPRVDKELLAALSAETAR